MTVIDAALLTTVPASSVTKVAFYKRDEITTDVICCEVVLGDEVWTFHEELVGWDSLLTHLSALPDFRADWFSEASQPAFGRSEFVAFSRPYSRAPSP